MIIAIPVSVIRISPFLRHSTFDIRHSYCAMLDIRRIREKPDFVHERLATRGGGDEARIDDVLRVDVERRKAETKLQQLNADRKKLTKEIGGNKSRGESTDELEQQVRQIGEQIANISTRATAAEDEQNDLLLRIANLPHESVPIGKDATANRVVRTWGEKPLLSKPDDHIALGAKLRFLDMERAAKLSGSGFICFTGAGARLERALINFMVDLHTREHAYMEISPHFWSGAIAWSAHRNCRSSRKTCTQSKQ